MIEGSVDLVTVDGAVGWLGEKDGGPPVEVVASLRGQVIGEATASLMRPDLAHAGFNMGRCGFEMAFGARLDDRDLAFVSFSPKGSQLLLPRSSQANYFEALQAIAATFPASGRPRSVLGGLWTDRTDALQIVVGRARAGLAGTEVVAVLRNFVGDGFVELRGDVERQPPSELSEALAASQPDAEALGRLSAALAAHALTPSTIALLKAAFDDTPVFYRPRLIVAPTAFAQGAAFEAMSSPAEMVVAYVPLGAEEARFDYVQDSHAWPEFSAHGASRWAPESAGEVAGAMETYKGAVQSRVLQPGYVTLVGPGLIHRAVAAPDAPLARIVLSPQRVSPLRHLNEEWIDVTMEGGVRGRV